MLFFITFSQIEVLRQNQFYINNKKQTFIFKKN